MVKHIFLAQIINQGFTRVERDDRLLDIFPTQTREKGIELWEKWTTKQVILLRFWIDHPARAPEQFQFSRSALENDLLDNQVQPFTLPIK